MLSTTNACDQQRSFGLSWRVCDDQWVNSREFFKQPLIAFNKTTEACAFFLQKNCAHDSECGSEFSCVNGRCNITRDLRMVGFGRSCHDLMFARNIENFRLWNATNWSRPIPMNYSKATKNSWFYYQIIRGVNCLLIQERIENVNLNRG